MKLSTNFTSEEFIRSATAARGGIDNNMDKEQTARAKELCKTILQPLRDEVGKAMNISSGFRSLKVNKKIGSTSKSQHTKGEAADFSIPGMKVPAICKLIIKLGLPYHQLIDEFSEGGQGWVHVSIAHKGQEPRKQYLQARRSSTGKTVYTEISRNGKKSKP
ncbi:MAG: D-Ala-D-Ala carboxypeptidase family metallohydrolase [Leptospirales bacterium]